MCQAAQLPLLQCGRGFLSPLRCIQSHLRQKAVSWHQGQSRSPRYKCRNERQGRILPYANYPQLAGELVISFYGVPTDACHRAELWTCVMSVHPQDSPMRYVPDASFFREETETQTSW